MRRVMFSDKLVFALKRHVANEITQMCAGYYTGSGQCIYCNQFQVTGYQLIFLFRKVK